MKKTVLILMLAFVVLASGFASGFAAGCANEDLGANPGNTAEQNDITSIEAIDEYLASVREQSDIIRTSLEQEELTQTDMNLKSMELSELWDGALTYMLAELENRLTEDEFSILQDDQLAWITERDISIEEAGMGFEGGSFYSLVVNMEAARITEERVLELYEMLK